MKRKARVAGVKFELSSGNVYADLGVKGAEAMLVKAELVMTISRIVSERNLTQAAAAELLGLTQPKLSNILRGQFHGVSERRLIDCLTRLGRDVEIVVREKPRSRASGRLSVTVVQPR
jgi:predicted XRE-type DNA-binding protein